jgi:transposase
MGAAVPMFGITSETRVFLKTGYIDGRLGYEGLRGLVSKVLNADVQSGLFAFCNRRANRIKLLWYHEGGYYIAAKRMDRGTVRWPRDEAGAARMSTAQLELLLRGVEFRAHSSHSAPRYRR